MVTVGIIELDFHADNLQELIEIFLLRYKGFNIDIHLILKKEVFDIIEHSLNQYENVRCHTYENSVSHQQCLDNSSDIIQKCDILFINTIAKSIKAFTSLKHNFMILRVHNANKQFAPKKHIDWSLNAKNIILLLKFFLKEVVLNNYFSSIKEINKNIKYFAFSDIEMRNYAIEKYEIVTFENSIYIPLKYYRNITQIASKVLKSNLTISVIGRIDYETRDIRVLTTAIQEISKHSLQREVCFKFIGTGRKNAMIELETELSALRNSMMSYEYTYENVSQDVMIDFINKSDIIISPLKINCKVGVFKETYGKTKVSGNFSDIAISPQPVFLPSKYVDNRSDKTLLSSYYDNSEELIGKLLKCINDKDYLEILQEGAVNEAKRRYGSETILANLSKIEIC